MAITERPLGYIESFNTLMHDLFPGDSNVAASIQLQGPLTIEYLQQALSELQKRHPVLRATIAKIDNQYTFQFQDSYDSIPLTILPRQHAESWVEANQDHIAQCFQLGAPLCRCIVLQGDQDQHDIIAFFHHSICDGRSAARFTDDLMTILGHLDAGTNHNLPVLPILNSIESYLDKSPSWSDYEAKDRANRENAELPTLWPYSEIVPFEQRRCRILRKKIPAPLVDQLRTRARAEKTTVNAALNAAVALSALAYRKQPIEKLMLAVPVCMRQYCNPPLSRDHMGNLISYLCIELPVNDQTDFWQFARDYRQKFDAQFDNDIYFPEHADIDYMTENQVKNFSEHEGCAMMFCALTNAGVMDFKPHYGRFQLKGFSYTATIRGGTMLTLMSATTVNGEMFCDFSYIAPMTSDEDMNFLATQIVDKLEQAVK